MKAITTLGGDTKLLLNISACKIIGLLGCKKSRSFPIIDYEAMTFEETKEAIDKVIQLYNNVRPHRSLGMRTLMQTLDPNHQNPLVKNKGIA